MADPREAIEQDVYDTLATLTQPSVADAYGLPEPFALVTREVLNFDEIGERYPALVIQAEAQETVPMEFSYEMESTLIVHLIIHLRLFPSELPAHAMNLYQAAVSRVLMQDISRGGWADATLPYNSPMPALWGAPPFIGTVNVRLTYAHDLRIA